MQAYKSNSRVAFVYQMVASKAKILNPNLKNLEDSSSIIIRVVQPGRSTSASTVAKHNQYDPTATSAINHVAVDRLVSAHVDLVRRKGFSIISSTTSQSGQSTKSITNVYSDPNGDTVIIDVVVDYAAFGTSNFYNTATVVLAFESGVEEAVNLALKRPEYCFINPDPFEMSLENPFGLNAYAGEGFGSTDFATFTAYNFGKAYREVDTRGKQVAQFWSFSGGGTSESGYKSYTQPFGIIRTAATPTVPQNQLKNYGGTTSSWANTYNGGVGAYASNKRSSLFWFSGNSDMSAVYLDSSYFENVTPEEEAPDQDIDFGKFFEFRPMWHYPNFSSASDTDYSMSGAKGMWPAGPARWGQNFGWYTAWTDNKLYKVNNGSLAGNISSTTTVVPGSDFCVGCPLFFNRSQYSYYYGGFANSVTNYYNPDFGVSQLPYLIGGDFDYTQPAALDGWISTSSFSSVVGNNRAIGGQEGPQSAKYQKLFVTYASLANFYGDAPGVLDYSGSTPYVGISQILTTSSQSQPPSSTSYLAGLYDLDAVKFNFAFFPSRKPTSSDTYLEQGRNVGSLKGATTTNNANFFYAGAAQTSSGEVLEPVFQGIARTVAIERYGVAFDTLAEVPASVASWGYTNFDTGTYSLNDAGGGYVSNLDTRAVFMASVGSSTDPSRRLNAIDLLMSLMYNGTGIVAWDGGQEENAFTIQNGSGKDKYDEQVRLWAEKSLSGTGCDFKDYYTNANISGIAGGAIMHAQDICIVNSAVNTISQDTANVPYGAVLALHPVGHPMNKVLTSNTTLPDLTAAINADTDISASSVQISHVPSSKLASFDEITGYSFPPYPVPLAPSSTVPLFPGTIRNNKFSTGSDTDSPYLNSNVSTGDGFTNLGSSNGGAPPVVKVGDAEEGNFLIAVGNSGSDALCLQILGTTVFYEPANSYSQKITNSSPKKITFSMRFKHTCSTLFKTDAGGVEVTGGTLATRVAKVLEIFPRIELNSMSAYSGVSTSMAAYAYTIIVQDEDDVDNIYITSEENPYEYQLTVVWTQQTTDIFNNPDDEYTDDVVVANSQFFEDASINDDYSLGYKFPSNNEYGEVYKYYLGEAKYGYTKGSIVTISSRVDWEDQDAYTTDTLDGSHFTIHSPFIAWGEKTYDIETILEESTAVYGCTDPTAINYNPDATVDDDSCIDCQDEANGGEWNLGVQGLIDDGLNGIRPGIYAPEGSTTYPIYGYILGAGAASAYLNLAGDDLAAIYNSSGASYGGAIAADNAYLGEVANCQLSIKAQLSGGSSGLTNILNSQTLADAGASYDSWQLRIIAGTDDLLDAVDLDYSYSETNPPPAVLVNATHVYSSTATGGTLLTPTWDNIVTPDSPNNGIKAGLPYLIELKFAPQNIPVGCDTFNSDSTVIYGLIWIGFCACQDPTNTYFTEAIGGQGYPWNNTNTFPIIGYSTGLCPDFVNSNNYNGDQEYPTNICFREDQIDGNPLSCDNMFLFCVAQQTIDCATTVNSIEDAYDAGNGTYYYDISESTVVLLIEGAYNYITNQYQFYPDLVYGVVILDPDGNVVANATYEDAIIATGAGGSQGLQHTFSGLTTPGEYTITWSFTGPATLFPEYFSDSTPCILTDTFTVNTPPNVPCPEIIFGCTDVNATNYDPTALFDDGSCNDPVEPCDNVINNLALNGTATAVDSDSVCNNDTIVVNGVEVVVPVITPSNNGSVTVSVEYDAPAVSAGDILSVSQYSILLFPAYVSNPYINTLIDSTSTLFNAGIFPTSTTAGSTLEIDGEFIGYFSPLFNVSTTDLTQSYTFTGLPPGLYYYLPIPNLGDLNLGDCGEEPVIRLEDYISQITIGTLDPESPCEEPCVGLDCNDYVLGCTDPEADNYDPAATINDGSCLYSGSFCDQNPTDPLCIDCVGADTQGAPRISSGRLDETICDPVNGSEGYCTDPNACNYNPDAPLEQSNNQICDYCSCNPEDPDCDEVIECDPDVDPDCQGPEPECPDPGNPACDPTIFDPCPTGECPPPPPPCIALGNCEGGPDDGGPDPVDPFDWDEPIVELTCIPQVTGSDGTEAFFDSVIQSAFKCMSDEGKKMLFRMKAGAQYTEEDLIKLSLISYLINGGSDFSELPCIFNCNYDSEQRAKTYDGKIQWLNKGARAWNSSDTFAKGDIVIYYYPINGKVNRSLYKAYRDVAPGGIAPRYPQSGWERVTSVRVRTKDTNNIATGEETYLQTFWEYLTRFCTSCEVAPNAYNPAAREGANNVDPTILKNHLDVKTQRNNYSNNTGSGILGEDGEEIKF